MRKRSWARTLGASLLLVVCAHPVDAQTVSSRRTTPDSATRDIWAALLAVADARSTDTTVIDRALGSAFAPLRAAAARVVGTNRVVARYATVRELLRSERDTAVARDAAFALGLAADTGSCEVLRGALRGSGSGSAAAWALGELGSTCGDFAPLLAHATSTAARAGLLRVAGKWTPFPDSVVVWAFTHSTLPAERWAALYALASARRPAGAALAATARRSAQPQVRELAARLMASTLQSAADSLLVVARLDTLLSDRAPHVRIAAVRSIATYRALARAPLAHAWTRERDANVRVTMAQSIASVVSDTGALWRRWWHSDTTPIVRSTLIATAWQAKATDALDQGQSSLDTNSDFRIRIAMIEGAAAAGADSFARRIAPRLSDADARVRAAALIALARSSPLMRDSLDFRSRLDDALADTSAVVRSAAVTARRRTDPQASTPPATAAPPADYARIVRDIVVPSLSGRPPALLIRTDRGLIRIVLDGVSAPMTSDHLMRLARAGYYENLRFHRVVPAFVAQGGDPRGDGNGGPGYAIRDELNRTAYSRGVVGMALSGPDTGGSQFFLTLAPQPHLDGHYTVFGRVVSGSAAMDALVQGDVMRDVTPLSRR